MALFRLMMRIVAWCTMYGGILVALRMTSDGLLDSPFSEEISLAERVSYMGLLASLVFFLISCLCSVCAVVLHAVTARSFEGKWLPVRPHMLLWNRLGLLLALGTYLAGEVADSHAHGTISFWRQTDVRALTLATCFALLLVVDVIIDWTYAPTSARSE